MARQWWPQPADETDEPNAADEVGEAAKIAPPPAAGARPSPQSAIFEPLAARLASDGIVVLRTDDGAQIPQALGPLAVARVRKYGDMVLTLLGKESHEPPATSH
jgi:hypothetical protein